jgi:hypothetical protein
VLHREPIRPPGGRIQGRGQVDEGCLLPLAEIGVKAGTDEVTRLQVRLGAMVELLRIQIVDGCHRLVLLLTGDLNIRLMRKNFGIFAGAELNDEF